MTLHSLLGKLSSLVNYGIVASILSLVIIFKSLEYLQTLFFLMVAFGIYIYAKVEDIRLTIFGLYFANVVINDMLKNDK